MGFFDFLGGSDSGPREPSLDPRALRAQTTLQGQLASAQEGKGFFPAERRRTRVTRREDLGREFARQERNLPGQLNRLVPREDIKVRDFIRSSLTRGFARAEEDINRVDEERNFRDKLRADELALGSLTSSERVAAQNTADFERTSVRRSFAPNFASEFIGGGSAGFFSLFGKQQKSGGTTFPNPQAVFGAPNQ